ncbi:TauD/TfdA dioxygenase family protein [Zestomonas carbonaria]|uniref:Alpha-ketoglutarate-dependent sulfate ester dioxygenase n=1 Tax=Zestomonas carbonaria TaxID=2762745 RepID=A0A7U7IB59_9GAMM|nr:TauD/TfdA family dioxygenase [Pseudomonas carbonaria]CAD5110169.1 Alpha-ketoglutarate-dependent sulfate ester dioxygenase [Pseudomonas carbonaria]
MSNAALAVEQNAVLEIHPVAGRIGAEIRGVKLSADLDAATVEAIQQALVQYKVIFFRDQTHLDDQGQEAFAKLLGDPVAHPTVPVRDGTAYVLELDGAQGHRASSWHTDVTFVDAYPKASILRSVVAAKAGGDTVWANTATAYDDLPAELRELADKLWAVHSNEYDYAGVRPNADPARLEEYRKVFASTVYETEHPVVRVHPVSGERTLLLGHFVKRLKGFSQGDSAQLFNVLQSHVIRLENTVRWRWREGDVAIWDNRATQHYAVDDYGTQDRVVRRVTLAGDVPVGVDGQRSRTVRKG